MFSGKMMDLATMGEYYLRDFGGTRHLLGQRINASVNIWALRELGVNLRRGATVLDIGCGYGFLLSALARQYGVKGVGVEVSASEADYGRRKLGLNICNCALNESGLGMQSFDIILICEVIEHIPDPIGFLREAAKYVKPDGVCVLITDNFGSSAARKLGCEFPKWIPHSHISHFTPLTLEAACERAGFTVSSRLSITPWETKLRQLRKELLKRKVEPQDAFDLEQALRVEKCRYNWWYPVKRLFSCAWARMTAQENLDGSLMFVCLQHDKHVHFSG